jgi:hypothetical protein
MALAGTSHLHQSSDAWARLNALGYRKLSARPKHHAQETDAIEEFKKISAAAGEIAGAAAKGKQTEIWFQDEARIGQKNKITRRRAKRGTRPSAPHDQRTRYAYIFGAICPTLGKAAALVMPWCDTHAMSGVGPTTPPLFRVDLSRTLKDVRHLEFQSSHIFSRFAAKVWSRSSEEWAGHLVV